MRTGGAPSCATPPRRASIRASATSCGWLTGFGGGDSFAAGLVHGLVSRRDLEATLKFAVAASALQQTIPGDFHSVSVQEVERLVAGDASGKLQR
ncbi:MAG: PfkB family carbohydrate kinase [Vicinamibacterales bacterium]